MDRANGEVREIAEALAPYVPRVLLDLPDAAQPTVWEVEGTLVFADVSGFTRMTERLAQQGRIGAEQVVSAISAIWTSLLNASEDGGDVLKFGGDALLILYQGHEHARRAVHSSLAMQRELARVGRVPTPKGNVRLRMSVGVHSDRFPLLTCGRDHLELLVIGPGATTTVETESAAEAGEVLVSHATARLLDPASTVEPDARGVVVRRVPPLAPSVAVPPPPDRADRFIPVALRDRLGPGREVHEHRRATVAFVHVGGVDETLAAHGVAEAHARLQAATCGVQDVLDRLGILLTCTDIGADGVKFMLTSGAPDACEDDAGRMLRGLAEIVRLDVGLPIRAGVNAGPVFAGAVGAPQRRTYSTMGDATNLAARMMGKAPWGGVLATRWTCEQSRTRFDVTPVEPMTVKGKRRPVDAALVHDVARDERWREAPGAQLPLIGRDAERDRLLLALDEVRATGRGRVVDIVGDHGLGAGRLVDGLLADASTRGVATVAVTCQPFDDTVAYAAASPFLARAWELDLADPGVTEAAVALVRRSLPEDADLAPLLGPVLGLELASTPRVDAVAPRFRPGRTAALVGALLRSTHEGPTLVVVEDAHDLDASSRDLLSRALLAGLDERPWLVVTTRRESGAALTDGVGEELRLAPLDHDATARILDLLAERVPVPVHLHDELVRRSGGNPGFLEQLVAALVAGEELPPTVEGVLAARIDRLPPTDRRVLRTVSVLGRRFDDRLLDRFTAASGIPRPSVLPGLLERDGEGWGFASELLREVAYAGLTYVERRRLHGLVADVLDPRDRPSLPSHLVRAERWDAAWHAAVAAGDRAAASGASATAASLYAIALQAAERGGRPDDEIATVAERRADALLLAGEPERAVAAYAVARSHRAGTLDRLRLVAGIARCHERSGAYTRAMRWVLRALRQVSDGAVDAGDAVARSRIVGALQCTAAGVRYRQGRVEEAVAHGLVAVREAAAAGDDETVAHASYLLDGAYVDLGMEDEARRWGGRALRLYEKLGDTSGQAQVLNTQGVDAFLAGDVRGSIALYARARDLARASGDVVTEGTCVNNLGESYLELDDLDAAHEAFREALRIMRGARNPLGASLAVRNLGLVSLRRDRAGTSAVAHLVEAREGFEAIGATMYVRLVEADLATAGYAGA